MIEFDYNVNNVHVLCRTEEEFKKALEIGISLGFMPDYYTNAEEVIEKQLDRYRLLKENNKKITLHLYFNEDTMFTTMFAYELERVTNKRKLRSFYWLKTVYCEYLN